MSEQKKTRIKFITRTDEQIAKSIEGDRWHVVVGGIQCGLNEENIGKQMPDFMQYAYQAGIDDEKRRMASVLGLWKVSPFHD